MRSSHSLLAGLAAMILPSSAAAAADPPTGFALGERFPEIVLPSLSGEPLSIASFRGHKLVLHLWASW